MKSMRRRSVWGKNAQFDFFTTFNADRGESSETISHYFRIRSFFGFLLLDAWELKKILHTISKSSNSPIKLMLNDSIMEKREKKKVRVFRWILITNRSRILMILFSVTARSSTDARVQVKSIPAWSPLSTHVALARAKSNENLILSYLIAFDRWGLVLCCNIIHNI